MTSEAIGKRWQLIVKNPELWILKTLKVIPHLPRKASVTHFRSTEHNYLAQLLHIIKTTTSLFPQVSNECVPLISCPTLKISIDIGGKILVHKRKDGLVVKFLKSWRLKTIIAGFIKVVFTNPSVSRVLRIPAH